jgi:uncharacterized protein with NRDE domain
MCIVIYFKNEFKLLILSNRDEVINRESSSIQLKDSIYAGIDREGGNWLGLRKDGKFGFITNFVQNQESGMITRGSLVSEYLRSPVDPQDYVTGNIGSLISTSA